MKKEFRIKKSDEIEQVLKNKDVDVIFIERYELPSTKDYQPPRWHSRVYGQHPR